MEGLGHSNSIVQFLVSISRVDREEELPDYDHQDEGEDKSGTADSREEEISALQWEIVRFCSKPRSRKEIASNFQFQSTAYVMQRYVHPLLENGILQMTLPDRPRSKNQRFFAVRAPKPDHDEQWKDPTI